MTERFRPNRNVSNNVSQRVSSRVPVNRQVPSRQEVRGSDQTEPTKQQSEPTQQRPARNQEVEQEQKRQAQTPPRRPSSPMSNVEEEYIQDSSKSKKGGMLKKALIGIFSIVLIAAIGIGASYYMSSNDWDPVDSSQVTGDNTSPITATSDTKDALSDFGKEEFSGEPVPVKWPSDIQPTRMELFLDPQTSKPVLLLVGDKAGLGTVLRSYNQSGDLTGFWVIVPDEPALDQNNNNNTNDPATSGMNDNTENNGQ